LLGGILLADAVGALIFGRAYARFWQQRWKAGPYERAMGWLARRPTWMLRTAGAVEGAAGLAILGKSLVGERPGVRSLYRDFSRVYDAVEFIWRDKLYRQTYIALERALSTYVPPGGRVLDLGAGTGANLGRLLALGSPFGAYVGVDMSEDMLAKARSKFGDVTQARFEQLDLLADALPEGPFDVIVSTWVFEHLPELEPAVQKAWERLRPGGHAIFLFEVEGGCWSSRLGSGLLRLFNARLIGRNEYERFPGLISAQHFESALTPAELVVLGKPDAAGSCGAGGIGQKEQDSSSKLSERDADERG